MNLNKIFYIFHGNLWEIRNKGYYIFKELLKNPHYSLYKMFQINPKYKSDRLKSFVKTEETILKKYITSRDTVIDVGCGEGRNSLKIVEELNLNPKSMVMMDINEDYVNKLNTFVKKSKYHRYSIVKGSVYDIEFKDNSFDVVLCMGGVLSLADGDSIENGLLELKRIAKNNGILIFHIITKERLIKIAEERGNEDSIHLIKENDIYPNWNVQYGEGSCRGWGVDESEDILSELGLKVLDKDIIYVDYTNTPDSILFACKKIQE